VGGVTDMTYSPVVGYIQQPLAPPVAAPSRVQTYANRALTFIKNNALNILLFILQYALILAVVFNTILAQTFNNEAQVGWIANVALRVVQVLALAGVLLFAYLLGTRFLDRRSIIWLLVAALVINAINMINFFVGQGYNLAHTITRNPYGRFFTQPSLTRTLLFLFLLAVAASALLNTYPKYQLSPELTAKTRVSRSLIYTYFVTSLILLSSLNIEFISHATQITWLRNPNLVRFVSVAHAAFYLLILVGFANILSYLFIRAISDFRDNRSSFALAVASSIMLGLITNFLIQYSIFVEGHQQRYRGLVFQTAITATIFLLIYLLTNRYLLGTYINVIIIAIFVLSNYFKFASRFEPVTLDDLAWLTDIRSLIEFSGDVNIPLLLGILAAVIASFFLVRKRFFTNGIFVNNTERILATAAALAMAFSFYTVLAETIVNVQVRGLPRTNVAQRVMRAASFWRGTSVLASRDSAAMMLLWQTTSKTMFTPDDYSPERMQEIEERYSLAAADINKDREHLLTDQTIIFILSESLANPSRLPYFQLSENPTPFIDSLVDHTGGLQVSPGFGGGTANIEFQALTGMSMNIFDNSINVAYNAVVPNMYYFPIVSKPFEDKIVIHPVDALSYNRRNIYLDAGFREFIALNNGTVGIDAPEFFGDYVSDEMSYQLVLDNLVGDEPQFINLLTMQNHTPFNFENNPLPITFVDTNGLLNENRTRQFENYLTLIHETDRATYDFLSALQNVNKEITMVFYGDHLPGLYPQSIFSDQPQLARLTDYFIWNNKHELPSLPHRVSGSFDFIPQLLDVTNSKVTPWQALLTKIDNELPVLQHGLVYDREDGHVEESYDFSPEQQQLIDDYELIHYDLTMGNGYLEHDFFEDVNY
jgi:hypothetical protein